MPSFKRGRSDDWDIGLVRLLIQAGLDGVSQGTISKKFPSRTEETRTLLEQLLEKDQVQKFHVTMPGSTNPTTIWRATELILDDPEKDQPLVGSVH